MLVLVVVEGTNTAPDVTFLVVELLPIVYVIAYVPAVDPAGDIVPKFAEV